MDWLLERTDGIEQRLARRHLRDGEPLLYDLSSSYFEGRHCPLATRGYSHDQRRGSLQIVYGLLCDRFGRPIAVEVFSGNATPRGSPSIPYRSLINELPAHTQHRAHRQHARHLPENRRAQRHSGPARYVKRSADSAIVSQV
jgi:hypothetical protein